MNDPTELWRHDAVSQAALRRAGDIAPGEAVETAIERAQTVGPAVNAFAHTRFADARAEATSTPDDAPFAGVPFAVKDWKCTTEGEPSTWGMRAFVDISRTASVTTELAYRYRRAGLVSIGRTSLPELAFGPPTTEPDAHGPCRNPWNPQLSVGGSSGGSAAVVAAGIVPVANASDGGGSLRIPAACTGLVGLKVSRGRISNSPGAEGRGTKVEGHIARSVRDVAAVLDATAGALPGEPFGLASPTVAYADRLTEPPAPLRIGFLTRAPGTMDAARSSPGSANEAAVADVVARLRRMGHELDESHPTALDEPMRAANLYAAERAALRTTIEAALGRPLEEADVEPRTWAMFGLAAASTGPAVIEELGREQVWARRVASWWRRPGEPDGFDLLVTPTLGRDVPAIGELKETAADPLGASVAGFPMAWFTYPFNVTGQPAISVPVVPATADSPPVSVQLVASIGREDLLLQVAAALEADVGWQSWWAPGAS
ncbi:MAG: amidase [Actinomycetota bacterium]